jgi:hypothetical protein
MSLNIPQSLLNHSKQVNAVVNLDSLGPRQIVSYKRFLATGIIKSNSVSATLALAARRSYGFPSLTVSKWGVNWYDICPSQDEELLKLFTAMIVAQKLSGERSWFAVHNEVEADLSNSKGRLRIIPSITANILRGFKFAPAPAPTTGLITIRLWE